MKGSRAIAGLVLILGLTAGCKTTPVYFRDPTTGHVAQCGPYWRLALGLSAEVLQHECMSDLHRRGYDQIPAATGDRR